MASFEIFLTGDKECARGMFNRLVGQKTDFSQTGIIRKNTIRREVDGEAVSISVYSVFSGLDLLPYLKCHGVIIAYDVSKSTPESMMSDVKKKGDVSRYTGEIVLVGHNRDLSDEKAYEDFSSEYTHNHVLKSFEVNLMTGINVEKVLHTLIRELKSKPKSSTAIPDAFQRFLSRAIRWAFSKEIRSNCKDIYDAGDTTTGFKTILPDGINPVRALCVMDTDGGGWSVIQKRESASDFYKSWQAYKDGFGDEINFWIGLENIHRLTSIGNYELRVDLRRSNNETAAAKYGTFTVEGESALYRLSIGNYSYDPTYVNPGDSLWYYNGMKFSTYDRDNDLDSTNCAQRFKSGDWHNSCHEANLNGEYGSTYRGVGINWYSWSGQYESLIYTRMMIRPK